MKPFEYNGDWWLPRNPKKKISGTLRFNPFNIISLKLNGSFRDHMKTSRKISPPDIILGRTSEGKAITLYKCFEKNLSIYSTNSVTTTFESKFILIGYHFEKKRDILFDSISLNYPHLEEWIGMRVFEIEKDNNEFLFKKYTVSYSFPEKITTEIDNTVVSFEYKFQRKLNLIKDISLKHITFLKLEPKTQTHFDDYINRLIYNIQTFLSLAIGKALHPLIIEGRAKLSSINSSDSKPITKDILIFYPSGVSIDVQNKFMSPDMLFSFSVVLDNFGEYLTNWFKKSKSLKPVYDLYFGVLYSSSIYLHHEFLSLVQAIESYHRRRYKDKYLSDRKSKDVYNALISAIPKGIESDFKYSLKNRFRHINEFSLRKRLKELLNRYNDVTSLLIHDEKIFIEDVVNTRNFLTHYDKKNESKANKGKELYNLVQKIKFLLEVCFLMELEIPIEKIKELISISGKYAYLRNIRK